MECKLTEKRCKPCEGIGDKFNQEQIENNIKEISGWELDDEKLLRTFTFENFVRAIEFVNKLAKIAEEEHHHPNLTINYNKVAIEIYTHAVGGLTENDFILAAKINGL